MFKDVIGYESYFQVNEIGEVYSKRTSKVLVQGTSKKGYKMISSKIGGRYGKYVCLRVHRMVAEAFIPNPDNKPYVNHLDGNKQNNCLNNLEWATASENNQHAYDIGLKEKPKGTKNQKSILTDEDVLKIRELYVAGRSGFGKRKIAKVLNLPLGAVENVTNKGGWSHIKEEQ